MEIFIPTLSRWEKIEPIKYFSENLLKNTTLVIQPHEQEQYSRYKNMVGNIMVLPSNIKTIAPTREYIIKNCGQRKIFFLDDDIAISKRVAPRDWHLRYCKPEETEEMFEMLSAWMDEGFAHVGVSAREGANRCLEDYAINQRYMRLYGYNLKYFGNIEYNRVDGMEDFDTALQLLKQGYPVRISYLYAQGQGASQASGGCSNWRTLEMHSANTEKLCKLHAPFVKAVEKFTKTAWGGNAKRIDPVISWNDAYGYGIQHKEQLKLF